jgi:hypothetical protein
MKTSIAKARIAIPLFSILILFSAGNAPARAQTTTTANPNAPPISPQNPSMASSKLDNDREGLYALWTDYKRNLNPEQQRFAYPTAKEYLRRWGGETDAETKEIKKWVAEYERQMYTRDMYTAYNAKGYAKVFELGRPALKSDGENFVALSLMVEAAHDNSLAGKTDFNTEAAEYAREAIKLLETGKVSKPDPFKSMDTARSFLNYALATMIKDQAPAEAALAYARALKVADNPYSKDPIVYHRMGIAIYTGQLAPLSAEYNDKFGGKQSSAEQAAMMSKIMKLADQTIDAYARAVALLDKPEQKDARAKALGQLTTLYKAFHNGSDAGLDELIAGVLSKPIP